MEAFGLAVTDARRLDLASMAGNLARWLVLFYSQPENQAFLAGAFAGAAMTVRMRMLPSVICSYFSGLLAQKAYMAVRDVRASNLEIASVCKALAESIRLNESGEADGADRAAEG